MLPSHYICTSCRTEFKFNVRDVCYYLGSAPIDKQVAEEDLYSIPVRPAWCKDCDSVCLVEDIAPLRTYEEAYGAARSGRAITYPCETGYMDPSDAVKYVEAYLRWRMERRHTARALCCGGSSYQFMDVEQPLLKHAECDFGVIEPMFVFPGASVGHGPGVHSPANIRLYDAQGELIGQLTWYKRDEGKWAVEQLHYPPVSDD